MLRGLFPFFFFYRFVKAGISKFKYSSFIHSFIHPLFFSGISCTKHLVTPLILGGLLEALVFCFREPRLDKSLGLFGFSFRGLDQTRGWT